MNEIIKQELLKRLAQHGWANKVDLKISRTKSADHGDYCSNVAMMLAGKLDLPPMKIARKIQAIIDHPDITRTDVASPGFLNFFITRDFTPLIQGIIDEDAAFFAPDIGKGSQVHLEYVSSNPTGPVHVGHGRSAAYGSSLANILRQTGFNVHTEYYVNDAGLQIDILTASIWLCILNIQVPNGCYTGDYLNRIAVDHPEINTQIPDDLQNLLANWPEEDMTPAIETLIACCKSHLKMNYTTLKKWVVQDITQQIETDLAEFGVTYNAWFHESSLVENQQIDKLINTLETNGHTYEKDGAVWFKSSEYGDEKDRVLKRSNGIWTYFANDLAYHQKKFEQSPDRMIDVFGADHHGYVPRVVAGLTALGMDSERFRCILIQFASLYRGKEKLAMSTRSGQFITLRTLYEEVGVDAARFFLLHATV